MKSALNDPYKAFFGTLANQVRLDIMKCLNMGDKNVNAIVKEVGYEQSSVSHSLRRLQECGFVTSIKSGKNRIYSLNKQTIKPLFILMETHMDSFCKHLKKKRSSKNA